MSDADAFDRIEMAQEIKTLRSRLAAAESRAERLAEAAEQFASQYGVVAMDCAYDNSCDDSGREPRCVPCELRAALAEHRDAKGKEAGR